MICLVLVPRLDTTLPTGYSATMEKRERTMITELVNLEDGLRENELRFIEDLSHKSDAYSLSERQRGWLEVIWDRECVKKCR